MGGNEMVEGYHAINDDIVKSANLHWEYLASVMKKMFIDGFIHGFKHGQDSVK